VNSSIFAAQHLHRIFLVLLWDALVLSECRGMITGVGDVWQDEKASLRREKERSYV
jgi:hypothetical protein